MADEIAQVVDLEYKGIYYLLKGTKAMITSMVSAIQALHTWQHKKWLENRVAVPGRRFRKQVKAWLPFWNSRQKCLKRPLILQMTRA